MNTFFKIALTVFIFLFSTNAYSTTYYVDFDNGSDLNDGLTRSSAWRNIPGTCTVNNTNNNPCTYVSNDWPQIVPGDIILIKSGATHDSTDGGRISIDSYYYDNGTSDKPITIQRDSSWGSGSIVIDSLNTTVSTYHGTLDIIDMDYIIIDGLTNSGIIFQNSPENGIYIRDAGTNGSELRHIEVYNSDKINIKIVSTDQDSPIYIGNISIIDATVHKTNVTGDAGSGILLRFGENILIQRSHIYDSGGDGIHFGSSRNSWILDNVVYNNGVDGEQGVDISKDTGYKTRDDSYNITIRGNIAYDNYKMNFDQNSGVHNVYYIHNIAYHTRVTERSDGNFHIYNGSLGNNFWINNTSTKGRDWGFGAVWSTNSGNAPVGDYKLYYINNISTDNGVDLKSGLSVFIGSDYNSRSFNPIFYNNNFNSCRNTNYVEIKGTYYTDDDINNGTGGWPGSGDISKDPSFVALSDTWDDTNLNLDEVSPCNEGGIFPFTTASSGSGKTLNLNPLVDDLDAQMIFREGDAIRIEGSGIYILASVDSSTQLTLTESAEWEKSKGVWFRWNGSQLNMGALPYYRMVLKPKNFRIE